MSKKFETQDFDRRAREILEHGEIQSSYPYTDSYGESEIESLEKLEYLYVMYRSKMCKYAERILGSNLLSKDAVQEVFMTYWEKRNEIEITKKEEDYLYTAVKNKCFDILKHAKVVATHAENTQKSADIEDFICSNSENPEQILILAEDGQRRELLKKMMLSGLSQSQKKIAMLLLEGMKLAEIAQKLKVSEGTVKTQSYRIREKWKSLDTDEIRKILK